MEVDENEILKADTLHFTSDPSDLKECNCYIITVPVNRFSKTRY